MILVETVISATIDGLLTHVQGNMAKVFGWYDNEWGYSERLKDFLMKVIISYYLKLEIWIRMPRKNASMKKYIGIVSLQ